MSSASRSGVLVTGVLIPVLAIVLILLTSSADDSGAAPEPVDLSDVTVRPMPELLADIALPADANGVVRVIEQLPETLSGRSRLDMPVERAPDTFAIAYGDGQHRSGQSPLRLTVQNVQTSYPLLAVPDAATVVMSQAEQAAGNSIPHEAGRDGDIHWLYTRGAQRLLLAGSDSSPWLYTFAAPAVNQLETILLTFFTTVMGEAPACMLQEEPQCDGL